jgi:2-hydroxychromene-2-carboxylate isomerase
VASGLGVDADAFEAEAESEASRQALIDSTDAALALGVFGAPTFVVDEEIYWGKDRMDFIDDALGAG